MPALAPITRQPTAKQAKIMRHLRRHAATQGRLPTSRQLADWLGVRQTAAYGQIVALSRRGLLERVKPEVGAAYYRFPQKHP